MTEETIDTGTAAQDAPLPLQAAALIADEARRAPDKPRVYRM
jgi:excinuclease ABC subunit C